DAEIEQEAIDAIDTERSERVGKLREPAAAEHEPRVVDRSGALLGVRVAVERNEPPRRTQPFEDRARVPATTERRIDVNAIRIDRERAENFVEQDGDVFAIGHQRLKPSSSGGRPPAGKRIARAVCSFHFASSHSSNLLPCPTRTMRCSSPAYWRS